MSATLPALVLASASRSRAAVLAHAGVPFVQDAAAVDEDAVKARQRGEGASARQCALALAELKALAVSPRHPGALVLGCDQMLDCDGRWFDKPKDIAAARAQLADLRGRTHVLVNGMVLVRDGRAQWSHADAATLRMRAFSDAFLDGYLGTVGEAALHAVGAYQLEGRGAQLFERIDGDFFSILGLPLLPLLAVLREHGLLQT